MAMTKRKTNPKVDAFLEDKEEAKWKDAFTKLRKIALTCPLTEELKWGKPCYEYEGHNVVLMHGFKEYCALLFTKGALLRDPQGLLVQQTENVQAARQIRFKSAQEVDALAGAIKAYILDAIEVEKSGAKVEYKQTEDFAMPPEFKARLDSTPSLKAAFEALTPGRQRGYLLYFAAAKQSQTRSARIEKSVRDIYNGKGLND
jgi:uncharacterized protein YdeI (YjbR/CyaY-like superfamily)